MNITLDVNYDVFDHSKEEIRQDLETTRQDIKLIRDVFKNYPEMLKNYPDGDAYISSLSSIIKVEMKFADINRYTQQNIDNFFKEAIKRLLDIKDKFDEIDKEEANGNVTIDDALFGKSGILIIFDNWYKNYTPSDRTEER